MPQLPMARSRRGDFGPVARELPAPYLGAAVVAVLLGLTWGAAGSPQATQDSPSAFVQSVGEEVVTVLENRKLDRNQRRLSLRKIFKRSFDTTSIARFALGRYWRTATEKQKARYLDILPDYVARVYAGQLSSYSGETFIVLRERRIDGKRSLVNAEIRRSGETSLRIDFRVRHRPEGFSIIDILVENVSLLIAKRAEFSSVISREGMDGFLARLRRMTERT